MSQYYIGLSTTGHDPSFAIVNEKGIVIFAEATERHIQDKRAWGSLPDFRSHIEPVLKEIILNDPSATFVVSRSWKGVKSDLPVEVSSALMPEHIGQWIVDLQALVQSSSGTHCKAILKERLIAADNNFDHHLCHAVSAVYFSEVSEAACLVIDGEGEVGSASLFDWSKGKLTRKWRSWGPASLGTFYGVLTELCGFSMLKGEEWKVMGLAPYGTPTPELVEKLSNLLSVENGKPTLNLDADLHESMQFLRRYSKSLSSVQEAADLAASGQQVYSNLVDQIVAKFSHHENLILTGGCALNSSYNGTIKNKHHFDKINVPPAPADDGNSIGAAILAWQQDNPEQPIPNNQVNPFLGSNVDIKTLHNLQQHSNLNFEVLADSAAFCARQLAEGKIIGVMRGRAEFGPRALGNRSILADPRSPDMKDRINALVKGRESYRPFAPVIPKQYLTDYFDSTQMCPYMSFTLPWKDSVKASVPAVVHENGTGRAQTVDQRNSPWLYQLTMEFEKLTTVPVILNTSFNVMGKPIINSVHDAISVLLSTGLDAVLINDTYITKE